MNIILPNPSSRQNFDTGAITMCEAFSPKIYNPDHDVEFGDSEYDETGISEYENNKPQQWKRLNERTKFTRIYQFSDFDSDDYMLPLADRSYFQASTTDIMDIGIRV